MNACFSVQKKNMFNQTNLFLDASQICLLDSLSFEYYQSLNFTLISIFAQNFANNLLSERSVLNFTPMFLYTTLLSKGDERVRINMEPFSNKLYLMSSLFDHDVLKIELIKFHKKCEELTLSRTK